MLDLARYPAHGFGALLNIKKQDPVTAGRKTEREKHLEVQPLGFYAVLSVYSDIVLCSDPNCSVMDSAYINISNFHLATGALIVFHIYQCPSSRNFIVHNSLSLFLFSICHV